MICCMGYLSKVQVIQRAGGTRQFYLICPAPLAEALEIEKGEEIEWVVEDQAHPGDPSPPGGARAEDPWALSKAY